jgi:hypothetical protein
MQRIYEKLQFLNDMELKLVGLYIDQLTNPNQYFSQESSQESEDEYESYLDFITINDYLLERSIDEQEFFLKHNDVRKMEFANIYGTLRGLRCCACKLHASECNCVYICGLCKPTGQVDRFGNYCQYEKCKYFTDDWNDIVHECKGVVVNSKDYTGVTNSKVYKFQDADSRSCILIDI